MNYTQDQKNALQIIKDWWGTFNREQCLMLSGAAGTGKTTLISNLPKELSSKQQYVNISYATLTAKAALVLRNKGIPASTIHSLIYDTKIKEDPITHRVKYFFTRKSVLGCDLIVIDEASMVSDQLYADLKSFGKPIIFIGDKFQLPPINSEFNLMDDKFLSYSMTEIVRQKADNLIIAMATKLRNREQTPFMRHHQFTKVSKKFFDMKSMNQFDQIITGKNKTRIQLNKFYRKDILHFNSEIPIMGDKVIFLKNNYEDFVFNGQQVVLDKQLQPIGKDKYTMIGTDVVSNEGVCVDIVTDFINTLPIDIEQKKYNKVVKSKTCNLIDYAYTISCHKCVSQNTNIFTDKGIIKIKDYNGQKVFNGTEFVYPKQFIKNGKNIVKTITTHNGFSNTTTLNHMHVVLNENCQLVRKSTEELNIGDIFLIPKNINNIEKQYLSKETKYIPKIINEQFAQWLGLFIADGCLFSNRKNGFRLLKSHKDVVQRFQYLTNKLFNVNYQIKEYNRTKNTCYMYQLFNMKIVKQLFQVYPCLTPNKKYIPTQILLSKNSVQKAFLKGVFQDGFVDKDGQIVFSSSIQHIAKDVQMLLLNNKIVSRFHLYTKANKFKQYRISILYDYLNDFKKEIGFVSKYKNNKCIIFERSSSRIAYMCFANMILNAYKNSEGIYKDGFGNVVYRKKASVKTAKQFINNKKFIDTDEYQKIKYITDNYQLDVVQNISDCFKEQTYCFQIENSHMFVQNGILSGNSQGSQWDKVLVIDDYFFYGNEEMRYRWLYTAITRASQSVTWVV